jgi:hypothetical protein
MEHGDCKQIEKNRSHGDIVVNSGKVRSVEDTGVHRLRAGRSLLD